MTASEMYLLQLKKAVEQMRADKQHQKPKPTKPTRLPGGCLLYRLPIRRA